MNHERVFVCIPAYNEAGRIGPVLEGVKKLGLPVLVIDDGSADGTCSEAESHGVQVLKHEVNRGKGEAIQTALRHVLAHGAEAVVFLDADGQHLPDELPRFLEVWQKSHPDMIIGSRMRDNRSMPLVRKASNGFSSLLISAIAGGRVTDSQSGYRLLSRRMMEFALGRVGGRFGLESELIIDALWAGMTYEEVPITCLYGDKKSHFHPVRDSFDFLRLVGRKGVNRVFNRR